MKRHHVCRMRRRRKNWASREREGGGGPSLAWKELGEFEAWDDLGTWLVGGTGQADRPCRPWRELGLYLETNRSQ